MARTGEVVDGGLLAQLVEATGPHDRRTAGRGLFQVQEIG